MGAAAYLSLFMLLSYVVPLRAQVGLADTGILLLFIICFGFIYLSPFCHYKTCRYYFSVTRPPSIYAQPEVEVVYKIGEALRLICIATGVPTPR